MNAKFDVSLDNYLNFIRKDYAAWNKPKTEDPIRDKIRNDMVAEFNDCLRVEAGSKYLKVVAGGSAHSFIMLKSDGKFREGDILKAASWAAPARNFARGNILDGNFGQTSWTGAV